MVRSRSASTKIEFRLDQRSYNKPTNSCMIPIMELIAKNLECNVLNYKAKTLILFKTVEILSVSLTALNKIKILIDYFNSFPLIGTKYKDFKDWELVYSMILKKEHLIEEGKQKIQILRNHFFF